MNKWIDIGAQAVCIVASLGGLAVAAWVLIAGLPGREGIDAMFLLVVGLAFAVLFGAGLVLMADRAAKRGAEPSSPTVQSSGTPTR